MGLDLITKAEYKAYAGISSTTRDTEIDALIPRVSALVKNYCRRTFIDYATTEIVEHFNGGQLYFTLKEYPLIELISFESSTDYGQNYTGLVEYTDFALDRSTSNIHSMLPSGFPSYINGYRATYLAGFTSVPEDLKLAVIDLVTYYLRNDAAIHSNKAPGTNTVQIEYISTTSLPANIRRVLDLYVSDYI